ncbi:hypothetical protein [Halobaculum halobium]|uniref:hypothetical protein n=1 Tax=Halobaculum halobium TaxID=3032281 RepID=UPI0036F37CB7
MVDPILDCGRSVNPRSKLCADIEKRERGQHLRTIEVDDIVEVSMASVVCPEEFSRHAIPLGSITMLAPAVASWFARMALMSAIVFPWPVRPLQSVCIGWWLGGSAIGVGSLVPSSPRGWPSSRPGV